MNDLKILIERMCLVTREKESLLGSMAFLLEHLDETVDPMLQKAVVDQVLAVKEEVLRLDQVFLSARGKLLETSGASELNELDSELLMPLRKVQDDILKLTAHEKKIKANQEKLDRILLAIGAKQHFAHKHTEAAKAYKNLSKK